MNDSKNDLSSREYGGKTKRNWDYEVSLEEM